MWALRARKAMRGHYHDNSVFAWLFLSAATVAAVAITIVLTITKT